MTGPVLGAVGGLRGRLVVSSDGKTSEKPMEIGFFYDFHGILLEMAIRLPC